MKNKWTSYELGQLLIYEQPTAYIVQSTDYSDNYDIPVLTAGKSFILGHTNETDGVFDRLPVIIFDDFTTATQYVNFRFKVKSSAMKILHPIKNANLKFLYYYMKQIKFDNSLHKRYCISQYSNLDIPKRHQNLDLRGNYYRSSDYPKYYNLDAIDVGKVENIPCDFDGMMGVPITFMQNYNPDQFEIIGCSDVADSIPNVDILGQEWIAGYRAQGGTGHYTANMKSVGLIKPKYKIIFSRIMIRNKNPEPRRYPDED